jgi:hypothetical protein
VPSIRFSAWLNEPSAFGTAYIFFVAVSNGRNLGDASCWNVEEDKTAGDLSRDPFGDRALAGENHRLVRVRDGGGGLGPVVAEKSWINSGGESVRQTSRPAEGAKTEV